MWTNLLIDLFSKPVLSASLARAIAYLEERMCTVVYNLDAYKTMKPENIYQESHIAIVNSTYNSPRKYTKIFGQPQDSHMEIEKLGVCRYCKKFTIVISLEDCLDYVLHYLSDCSIDKVRKLENYMLLSRGILNVNYKFLDKFEYFSLLNVDDKLNDYLIDLYQDDSDTAFITNFFSEVVQTCSRMVDYIYAEIKEIYGATIVARSKGLATIVVSSDVRIEDEIVLRYEGKQDYVFKIKCLERLEHLTELANIEEKEGMLL